MRVQQEGTVGGRVTENSGLGKEHENLGLIFITYTFSSHLLKFFEPLTYKDVCTYIWICVIDSVKSSIVNNF